jgi:hypothetical protein
LNYLDFSLEEDEMKELIPVLKKNYGLKKFPDSASGREVFALSLI